MYSDTLISIIIPCYNDAQYIEQSVKSALNQTYPYKEVIVVDDGSNEETKAILKRIEPEITKLITQENFGQSKARNVGIEAAKGDYIIVLDSDDFFECTFCEKAIGIFQTNLRIKIVTCQAILLFPNNKKDIFIHSGGDVKKFMYSNSALGSAMFRKEDWESVEGYDENMRTGFEDWEFYIRILKSGGIAYVIQDPLYTYRKRDDSTTSKANKVRYELWYYIFTKHRDLYQDDYDNFISFFINRIKQAENTQLKYKNKIEFKIGLIILYPLRRIKSFFK